MNNSFSVKIEPHNSKNLSVSLNDILTLIEDRYELFWGLLMIEATGDLGDNKSMVDFESEINETNNIMVLKWNDLKALSDRFKTINEIILIGSKYSKVIRRYSNEEEMFSLCDYSIEMIDSSYWLIHSTQEDFLKYLKKQLPGCGEILKS
jgi:hypothetical protein